MEYGESRFAEQKTVFRLSGRNTPCTRTPCNYLVVCIGIIAQQREFKSAFARACAVAGSHVAAAFREDGHNVYCESRGRGLSQSANFHGNPDGPSLVSY